MRLGTGWWRELLSYLGGPGVSTLGAPMAWEWAVCICSSACPKSSARRGKPAAQSSPSSSSLKPPASLQRQTQEGLWRTSPKASSPSGSWFLLPPPGPTLPRPYFLLPPFPSCAQFPHPEFLTLVQAARLLWVKRA